MRTRSLSSDRSRDRPLWFGDSFVACWLPLGSAFELRRRSGVVATSSAALREIANEPRKAAARGAARRDGAVAIARQAAHDAQQPNRGHFVRRAVRARAHAARRGRVAVSCAALLRVRARHRARWRLRAGRRAGSAGVASSPRSRRRSACSSSSSGRSPRSSASSPVGSPRSRFVRDSSDSSDMTARCRTGAIAAAPSTTLIARADRRARPARLGDGRPSGAASRQGSSSAVFHTAVMLIAFYFFLLEGPRLRVWLERISPLSRARRATCSSSFAASRARQSSARRWPRCSRRWRRALGYLIAGVPHRDLLRRVDAVRVVHSGGGHDVGLGAGEGLLWMFGHHAMAIVLLAGACVIVIGAETSESRSSCARFSGPRRDSYRARVPVAARRHRDVRAHRRRARPADGRLLPLDGAHLRARLPRGSTWRACVVVILARSGSRGARAEALARLAP